MDSTTTTVSKIEAVGSKPLAEITPDDTIALLRRIVDHDQETPLDVAAFNSSI